MSPISTRILSFAWFVFKHKNRVIIVNAQHTSKLTLETQANLILDTPATPRPKADATLTAKLKQVSRSTKQTIVTLDAQASLTPNTQEIVTVDKRETLKHGGTLMLDKRATRTEMLNTRANLHARHTSKPSRSTHEQIFTLDTRARI